jgi:hypothetical protein
VSESGVLNVTEEPAVGAVMATLGPVTLTFTTAEVTTTPFESVTLAVSAATPVEDGVQETE